MHCPREIGTEFDGRPCIAYGAPDGAMGGGAAGDPSTAILPGMDNNNLL